MSLAQNAIAHTGAATGSAIGADVDGIRGGDLGP